MLNKSKRKKWFDGECQNSKSEIRKIGRDKYFNPNDNLLKTNSTKNCVNIKVNANPNVMSSGKTNSKFLKIPCKTPRHFGRL